MIPDAGHSPQFENPDAWIDALHGVPRRARRAERELTVDAHGGRLAVEVLRAHGVDVMFTLSGGHLFVLYDGAVQADLRLVDTRHEQTATFAAEGWAKVTRRLGCAALTAGPGVTNGVSAMTAARMNGSPMVVRRRPGAAAALGQRARCRSSTTCRSSRRS